MLSTRPHKKKKAFSFPKTRQYMTHWPSLGQNTNQPQSSPCSNTPLNRDNKHKEEKE